MIEYKDFLLIIRIFIRWFKTIYLLQEFSKVYDSNGGLGDGEIFTDFIFFLREIYLYCKTFDESLFWFPNK